ncbi:MULTISPECIES: LysR family transcriptional regulator [Halomonas]|uniref:LysR family transcriptional regulator n=1 Tax=Halomonas TaxID=2745 RepID=UPI001C95CE2D|nr:MULTISPECIES: LysR family transcriptional regulator [Halomonas]MED5294714.1 LysR family transcriptional regulator [Pseudomonadota bacterium]MBY5928455.1 LysR family transcriptional regulator [Halomonas sp. DP8Y7-3]MBY6208975.1 LysR family transcriptional regulator [Halomonas sp. DP3Y7-2]MBY6227445.1 LysR family transcriptional regulator [Halomonas sp. DP3Y7-1]MCA0914804.1 LysR family transcriptional regulator [Halomonas denitrificans]
MPRENFNDLHAFLRVAEKGSFTRAAAELGVSQSALSHTIRGLEARLGIRLLTRTTRNVSPTEAGDRLLRTIAPCFEDIHHGLEALSELRDKPAGTLRISTSSHAADSILMPKLSPLLTQYPDIQVELRIDNGLTDIVSERLDAGVRLGERVAKDMIATRIGPDMRMLAVAAPSYFQRYPVPLTPHELTQHNCISIRMPTSGGLYAWEFEKDGIALNVQTHGQLVVNNSQQVLSAALAGLGLAFLPEDMVVGAIDDGRLIQVLDDWSPPFPGFHLYYPNRRQASPAFSLLVEALRHPQ